MVGVITPHAYSVSSINYCRVVHPLYCRKPFQIAKSRGVQIRSIKLFPLSHPLWHIA
jgi:hypothetical protein